MFGSGCNATGHAWCAAFTARLLAGAQRQWQPVTGSSSMQQQAHTAEQQGTTPCSPAQLASQLLERGALLCVHLARQPNHAHLQCCV